MGRRQALLQAALRLVAPGNRLRVGSQGRHPIESLAQIEPGDHFVVVVPIVEADRGAKRRRIVDRVFELALNVDRGPSRRGARRRCDRARRGVERLLGEPVVREDRT